MPLSTSTDRKPLFDAVRRLLGRGFRQSEVHHLDNLIDEALGETPDTGLETHADGGRASSPQDRVPSVPSCRKRRRIGAEGIDLIKRLEGCARLRPDRLIEAYPDPGTGGEPWTIGWGATGYDDQTEGSYGARIGPGTLWTQAQCDARLASDLGRYAREVDAVIGKAPTTQHQFDAMVSFHYNTGAIARATLTKKHIAGDFTGAAKEFGR